MLLGRRSRDDLHPLDLGPAFALGISVFSVATLIVGLFSTGAAALGGTVALLLIAGNRGWRRTAETLQVVPCHRCFGVLHWSTSCSLRLWELS
jgi:hypothetical protein